VGLAINKISTKIGATGLFFQGSEGDQNSIYCHKPQEESIQNLKVLSDKFAGYIETALNNTHTLKVEEIRVKRKEITLPQVITDRPTVLRLLKMIDFFLDYKESLPEPLLRRLKFEKAVYEALWERYDKTPSVGRETEIQVFCFGDVTMLAHPAELFYCFHREIENQLAPGKVFVIGLANDNIGYVPSSDKYDISKRFYSYSAYMSPLIFGDFYFREDVGKILTGELVKLAKKSFR